MVDNIAIIGYACRLPGQVSTPDDLWELCTRGRSGWCNIPKDRFSFDAFHHPNPSKPGAFNPKGGYFLKDDIKKFDASFFNITAKEAISMDPQQRLLLETTFEALESAGLPKEKLAGRPVGVYIGGNVADYEIMNMRDIETTPMHQATGCAAAMSSNRISYCFDLRGPSMTFDTACSSSLVALHQAVQSLKSGESEAAVVGGCRLNILPDYFVTMSMSQLFNDTGKTFAFDDRAVSGFARGEGAGVVILKPLEAAIRDRDPIRAVVCTSGTNQDGRTQGITNPNGDAQRDLVQKLYQEASLDPKLVGYAEMHGTGTKVGDPIEARAVYESLSHLRSPQDPLIIGSVKSNVGHLEGASGIVALIKASMMLEKELILPNTNFVNPNPAIPMHDWNLKVLKSTRPWPRNKKYVSVSNYGFGGANAHAVLEMPPRHTRQTPAPSDAELTDPVKKLFVISANDKDSLEGRIKGLGIYFEQRPEAFEKLLGSNVAYTLGQRRSNLAYRLALSASSLNELGSKLAQTRLNATRVHGKQPSIGFVFTGQGAQWATMGTGLIGQYEVFTSALTRADEYLKQLGADFSLMAELQAGKELSRINSPHISQPACTAVQIGLVDLFRSWGIKPDSVVGHSSGEIAAAYAAGAFDADAAMALSYYRGCMTQKLKELYPNLEGGMIAIGMGPNEIRPYLKKLKCGYTTVACVNSPSSITVSGDAAAITELHNVLDGEEVFNRQLKIDVAYHSEHMARISKLYLTSIADKLPAATLDVEFYSSVYGRKVAAAELQPSYWIDNLVSTVQLPDALGATCAGESRPDILLEIGPHSTLKGPIKDTLKTIGSSAAKIIYSPSLLRGSDDLESVLDAAGTLFTNGAVLDMLNVNFPNTKAKYCSFLTDLPRYSWQHSTSYWHEARIPNKHNARSGARNDVLGVLAAYSNDLEPTWRNIIRLDDVPWLRHHNMQGMHVFPLAGYLAMAIEAAQQRAVSRTVPFDTYELREIFVSSALVLSDGTDTEATITLRPHCDASRGASDVWDEFKICSWDSQRGWAEHCRGLVRVIDTSKRQNNPVTSSPGMRADSVALHKLKMQAEAGAQQLVDPTEMYKILEETGAGYGPTFQGIKNAFAGPEHSRAEIVVQDTKALMPKEFEPELVIHPSLLDIFVHLTWPILGAGTRDFDTLYMPTNIRSVKIDKSVIRSPGESLTAWCKGTPDQTNQRSTAFDLIATRPDDTKSLIEFEGFVMTPIRDSTGNQASIGRKLCYKLVTRPFEAVAKKTASVVVDANGHASDGERSNGHVVPIRSANGVGNIDSKPNDVNGANETNGHATTPASNGTEAAILPETASHANGSGANGSSHTNGNGVNGTSNGDHADISGHDHAHGNGVNGDRGANGHHDLSVLNGTEALQAPHTVSRVDDTSTVDTHVSQVSNGSNGNTNGHAHTNGNSHAQTNENGHHHANGNGHTHSAPKGDSPSEVSIVELGACSRLAVELAGTLDLRSSVVVSFGSLDLDYAQEKVVILQCGAKTMRNVTSEEFENLKKILLNAAQVLWVYDKNTPEAAMSLGMARTIRSENMSKITMLGVSFESTSSQSRPAEVITSALDTLWLTEYQEAIKDMEFIFEHGELLVQRVEEDEDLNGFVSNQTSGNILEVQPYEQEGRRLKLQVGSYGALDTIHFIDDVPNSLGDNEIEIQVRATGVNFKDIVVAMGQVSQPYIGVECSGIVASVGKNVSRVKIGDRVMAMTEGAYSTYARCLETSAFQMPQDMVFEDACTIPVIFCTAYYALFDLGRLEDGERVLIHAAAGGVGQAAIKFAQMVGAEIYATVGSQDKKEFLMTEYHIPAARIFYSRDTTFADDVQRVTGGEGVDVVLNSLAGDILRETWDCLAPFGRFIEIGKADIVRNSRLDMMKFEYNCSFSSVDLTKVASYKPKLMHRLLSDVCGLFSKGAISPIAPITVYSIADTERAFRALQSGKAMGKLVVSVQAADKVMASKPKLGADVLRADATYILIGGTGGLGRSISKWMSGRGARIIVLVSRSATVNEKTQALIDELAHNGTKVLVCKGDASDKPSMEKVINEDLKDFPPIRGVLHGAMVLKDMLYEQMTLTDFHSVTTCKVEGALNLHEVLSSSPLDFFVSLSSIAGVIGNRGQAAYSAANVFLDDFMAFRRSQNLPGVSIDLAAVSNVGYLADGSHSRREEVLKNIGGDTIDESEVLTLFAAAVTGQISSGQCITSLDAAGADSFWLNDGKFAALQAKVLAKDQSTGGGAGVQVALSKAIKTASSKQEASQALYEALAAKLSAILVVPEDAIEPSVTLKSLGLDSLVAIEIRNWIVRETEVNVQVLELLSSGSIMSLVELVLKKMGI